MLARIAHELFWLGRDISRAEHTARMLDGVFHADVPGPTSEAARRDAARWDGGAGDHGRRTADGREDRRAAARARETVRRSRSTATPTRRTRCVRASRARARAARTVRDVISPRCGRRSTRSISALARRPRRRRWLRRPVLASTRRSRSAARCSGGWSTRTMLRDEAVRLPRRRRADRGGRHGAADAARRAPRRRTSPTPDAARRAGARAAQRGRRPAGLPPCRARRARRAAAVARFLLYDARYPGSVASSVDGAARRARSRRRRAALLDRRCCDSAG